MTKEELIQSYEKFFHITKKANVDRILREGLIPNKYADNLYHPNAPSKRAQICITGKAKLEEHLDSFRQNDSGEEFAVFAVSAEFISGIDFGLDWTFSGTESLSKSSDVESLKTSIEYFGTLACFETIPANELSLRALLVKDEETTRVYRVLDGEEVTMELDDYNYEIEIKDSDNSSVGGINFNETEEGSGEYMITWMYMDLNDKKYKGLGLGEEAVRFFKEYVGGVITARDNDGMRQDDGSHLTQDAPGFVDKMRRIGLIE